MISPFILEQQTNSKNLYLDRYPNNQVNRSLQAWDSADEYLINYLNENKLIDDNSHIGIFNDNFGALAANLTQVKVSAISDSIISQLATKQNLILNHLSDDKLEFLTSLDPIPSTINIVLYKIPKSKALLIEQLIKIKNSLASDSVFIACDKAKQIQKSTLALFEKYLGTTTTSLAVKKSRLVFCQLNGATQHQVPAPTSWSLNNGSLTLTNLANVFAREKLDIGARVFIEHLPDNQTPLNVIDLGCGNGVVGLTILANNPKANVTFVDESYMAVASAKLNVEQNFPALVAQCQFITNDCLSNFDSNSVDAIFCNPPFHQQNAVTDHIAWQMFKDSFNVLKKGGELRIVGNRQLGYHIKLNRLFNNNKLIASNNKFVVLSAIKE